MMKAFNGIEDCMRLVIYTLIALTGFAANSLLCRMALVEGEIEALSFTWVRLFSAAVFLSLLVRPSFSQLANELVEWKAHLFSAVSLALYLFAFSWAYLALDTGLGALILFATIQLVLNLIAQLLGDKLNGKILFGISLAFSGLVLLLVPGIFFAQEMPSPDYAAAFVMMLAGLGWAGFVYSGRQSREPTKDVALSFRWALILTLPSLYWFDWQSSSAYGIGLGIVSGSLASGLCYALWYKVLPQLGLQIAAQAQLIVPVFATLMGVVLLAEQISLVMLMASGLILLGITIAIRAKKEKKEKTSCV